ncbi:MAG: hypothetical protein CMG75_10110 [Candidatus Marinimicrobia bacterium]|nr:hypothetical protein [Candidatus Neomarinimicrobiota bacterium]|tara:strand:+ start:8486 stop:9487 length:1002 start_codon:yes stop_codon:yes gene_type:complete
MNMTDHIRSNTNLCHKTIILISFLSFSTIRSQQLIVLDIAPLNITDEYILILSDHFREIISTKLDKQIMPVETIREVLSQDKVNNRWCAEKWCAKEIGKLISEEEVIVSSIWKDQNIYRIKGSLVNINSDTVTNWHEFNFAGEDSSLFNEVEYMAYKIFNKSSPPEIQNKHDFINERSLALQGITEKNTRLKATLLSTAVPGLGQYYLKKKVVGGVWLSAQLILGSLALREYIIWRNSYKNFYEFEDLYLTSTDVSDIENYRNAMITTYDLAKSSIIQRQQYTNIISGLWLLNIFHAYVISPSTEKILEDISIKFSHKQTTNEFQLRLILALN